MKPLAVDLFCGLGGWTEGLLSEGYDAAGFDNERHVYGDQRYPAQLVLQDVLTLHGSQFRNAALIVASPPCQAYSYLFRPLGWSEVPTKDSVGTRKVGIAWEWGKAQTENRSQPAIRRKEDDLERTDQRGGEAKRRRERERLRHRA